MSTQLNYRAKWFNEPGHLHLDFFSMPSIIKKMSKKSIFDTLTQTKPGVLALFDPDRMALDRVGELTKTVCDQGITGILIGSSLLVSPHFDSFIGEKEY